MRQRRWIGAAAAAGALLLGVAGAAFAAPVLQEDFRRPVPGMRGREGKIVPERGGFAYQGPGGTDERQGSYLEYDLAGTKFRPAAGTIEFDFVRDEVSVSETIFTFVNGAGERILSFRAEWLGVGVKDPTKARIVVRTSQGNLLLTDERDEYGNRFQLSGALFPRVPRKGEKVHVALTWGPAGAAVYVNGAPVRGRVNGEVSVPGVLAAARKLVVGGEVDRRIPGGAWGMTRSLVANLQLHDEQLPVAGLEQAIVKGVEVSGVEHDAARAAGFSGKLVAGNRVTVRASATPGAQLVFDVVQRADFYGKLDIDWRGWGVYLEEKSSYEPGEVNLREVEEYRVFVGQAPIGSPSADAEPLARLEVGEQRYVAEGLASEGAYYTAVFALMRDGSLRRVTGTREGLPLAESAPGSYEGTYRVAYGESAEKAVVVCRSASGDGAALTDDVDLAIDTRLKVAVEGTPGELRADEKSTAEIKVQVTDANGNPVAGHKVRFLLATTSQYTGVVGGGAFTDMVGGALKENFVGETDLFGRVTATYTAGFAAKTAIVVARDMASGDTGAAWIKTYIQATADIQLEPVELPLAAEGYEIAVTSSDEWLTADGRSQARISARVTLRGEPVEGHPIAFALASGTGSLRVVSDTTDSDGVARAVYTAGKKIGMVVLTATDTAIDLTGSVSIELRSDAPAKIRIEIRPGTVPADGRSRADILVQVTDINDNPNEGAEVEFRLAAGDGRLRDDRGVTDRNGEFTGEFQAGRTPGTATVELTVRSSVPTDEEMAKARDLALAVTDYDFF